MRNEALALKARAFKLIQKQNLPTEEELKDFAENFFPNEKITPKEKLEILSIQRGKDLNEGWNAGILFGEPNEGCNLGMLFASKTGSKKLIRQYLTFLIGCLETKDIKIPELIIALLMQREKNLQGLRIRSLGMSLFEGTWVFSYPEIVKDFFTLLRKLVYKGYGLQVIRMLMQQDTYNVSLLFVVIRWYMKGVLDLLEVLIDRGQALDVIDMLKLQNNWGSTILMEAASSAGLSRNNGELQRLLNILNTLTKLFSENEDAIKNIFKLMMHGISPGFSFIGTSLSLPENTELKLKLYETFELLHLPEMGKKINAASNFTEQLKTDLQTALDLRARLIEKMYKLNSIKEEIGKNVGENKGRNWYETVRHHHEEVNTKLEIIREFLKNHEKYKDLVFSRFEEIENQFHFTKINLDLWAVQNLRPPGFSETLMDMKENYIIYFEKIFPPLWTELKKTLYRRIHRKEKKYFCSSVYEIATILYTLMDGRLLIIGKQDPLSDDFVMEYTAHVFLGIGLLKQYGGNKDIETFFWNSMTELFLYEENGNRAVCGHDEGTRTEFKKRNIVFERISNFVMRALKNNPETAREENYPAFINAIKWLCLKDENIPHQEDLLSIENIVDDLTIDENNTEGIRVKRLLESLLKAKTIEEYTSLLVTISQYENVSTLRTLVKEHYLSEKVANYTSVRIIQCKVMSMKIYKKIIVLKHVYNGLFSPNREQTNEATGNVAESSSSGYDFK